MNTGIIILAAGNSSRLGKPKQLLPYKGETLLSHTISAALATPCRPIIVVLGAYEEQISKKNQLVSYIINGNWQEGISSSITAGLAEILTKVPAVENVIIAVADQPFISATIFNSLSAEHITSGKNIIVSQYAETKGTPASFNKHYFNELMSLKGNSGAKHMLTKYVNEISTIPFELGHIDIDTETDYKNLTEQQ